MKFLRYALMAAFFPALFASMVSAGEPGVNIHVASHAYIVSVAPVDEESKNAENSMLYQLTLGNGGWRELGQCQKNFLPNGDVRFTREVNVDEDGVYYYTSRPIVGGKVESPPNTESPPQAVVVVDTLPPRVEIISPPEGATFKPSELVNISWTSSDENLTDRPAAVSFSSDGGKSWNIIGRELPAEGDTPWRVPSDLSGPAAIRLAVADRAGNIGRDLQRVEIRTEPVKTPTLPPIEETVKPPPPPPKEETAEKIEPEPSVKANRAWLYYLMALNMMRQNKPADALQYYWLTLKEDPDFIDAWAGTGLAYNALGAYKTAREVLTQGREKAPDRIDLMHLMGETYHAEGMALIGEARSGEDRMTAKGMIDRAVEWYGKALDKAAEDWRLAEQAASFYRLGEVCYYVNMDRDGARAYWKKILELHAPAPNSDLIAWAAPEEREKARQRYQTHTHMRQSLTDWQNWARGYLQQLDARERQGILDMMPAQKVTAIPTPQPLVYGSNAMNPGRDDGRSLFSLPAQLGSPAPVAATVSESSGSCGVTSPSPADAYRSPAAAGYSFYANPERSGDESRPVSTTQTRGRRSAFSGGPDRQPKPIPDPYAFPGTTNPPPAWHGSGTYGNQPINDW